MSAPLPSRPNLDHLRRQAKALLAAWKSGDHEATQEFIAHLPAASGLSLAAARRATFKLADAQSVVARRSGFASWKALTRHVEALRDLEGEWRFDALEVDGQEIPAAAIARSRMLFDGDRFRMESPEGNYDGTFVIDTTTTPMRLDITFVEGPEAGNTAAAIWTRDGDALVICLGLVGSTRPTAFVTSPGSGHALERLTRVSAARPEHVDGGTPPPPRPKVDAPPADPSRFDGPITPMLRRLEGEWAAVRLVTQGEPVRKEWLPYGSRVGKGNTVKVTFGGQVMLHARIALDETATPVAVDYLHLAGAQKGNVSLGVMAWDGEEVTFLMAPPGEPRPTAVAEPTARQTFSRWRRKG